MAYYGNHRDYSLSPLRDLAYNQAAQADAYADSAANARVDGTAGHAVQPGQNVGMGMGHDRGRMAAQESGNMMQQAMRSMEQVDWHKSQQPFKIVKWTSLKTTSPCSLLIVATLLN